MHTYIETAEIIKDFIYNTFPRARANAIGTTDSLFYTRSIDSFGILEIISFIESTFNVTFSDEDISDDILGTIDSLANFVMNNTPGCTPLPTR